MVGSISGGTGFSAAVYPSSCALVAVPLSVTLRAFLSGPSPFFRNHASRFRNCRYTEEPTHCEFLDQVRRHPDAVIGSVPKAAAICGGNTHFLTNSDRAVDEVPPFTGRSKPAVSPAARHLFAIKPTA